MWDKRIMRLLATAYIVEGVVSILAPRSMSRPTHWFVRLVDDPRNMRLGGTVPIALGIWLAFRQYQEEQPPQPWYRRCFGG
jgi:uncharacterized protein YjeT (DUF2065 family)